MSITIDDIRKIFLDTNKKYMVKDNSNLRRLECCLTQQTDFLFIFTCTQESYEKNKICISKIDYYLNHNLIKEI
ncbi:hypothetical protein J2Z76_002588 [Sedimentibacter acidaminivorans]|uniref:Uncharacterized protein n=1 Tax=Sedimentibacter acidaminivorans TaxID=913099 RepID=A0ABS4GGA3_9FIRM|nr:hypothetical protein [Sedimentibacter acidaminivorans]MBP1926718.1 hypothetical protein [Sedimentibacter acidaminivorans]